MRGSEVLIDQGWNRRKALTLLKAVSVQPQARLHRDQLIDALWPELDSRAGQNNLHKNLHHLRTALADRGAEESLVALRGDIVQVAEEVQIDLGRALALAATARGTGDLDALDGALDATEGELLPEDAYEDWLADARDELADARAQLLREVAAIHAAAGRFDLAIECTSELLAADPLDEATHRSLMQLFFDAGSRHRALRQYEACRDVLQTELGVEPSSETEALHARLLEEPHGPRASDAPVGQPPPPVTPGPARIPPPPTFGRERELELIEDALDAAIEGRGSAMLLVGEAGIGKSHLLHHMEAAAGDQGALALFGRAYELEAHIAYQPLRGALRQLLVSHLRADLEPLLQRSLYLRRLLPDASHEGGPAADSPDLQGELFEEVWRLMAAVTAVRPLVLLFDDLHDADEGTLRLVHFLARRAPEARILLVAAARTEYSHGAGGFGQLRSSLRRDNLARDLELSQLPESALRLVAQGAFEGERVETDLLGDIVARADGNPLFARELASSFIDEGWARFERGRWRRRAATADAVPTAAVDLLEPRLEHLSPAARDLLNVASVASVASSFTMLQTASGLESRVALDALDECISAFLLEEAEDGYRFRHGLVREAAYGRLTSARRQQLHRAVADALLASPAGADPAVIAQHLDESDEPWRAVPFLLDAGRRAERVFAHEQARQILERAVALVRSAGGAVPADAGSEAIEELADLERRTGNVPASVPLFEEAAARHRDAGNEEEAARARGKAALGYIILGDASAAQRHIEETLQSLTETSPQHVVSRTYYLLAQLHWHGGQHGDALAAAEQALLAAEDSDDDQQKAQAYEVLALACHSLGDWQHGVEYELNRQALGVSGFDTDEAFDAHL